MGNSLALYNPPVRVAEELAMLDVLSGGRLVAGFPVGTADGHLLLLRRQSRPATGSLRRSARPDHAGVASPKAVRVQRRYTKLRYVNSSPRPLQQPHPPVWIPGGGSSVETWDLAATHDYVYAYLSYYGYESGKQTMDGFWDYVTEPRPRRQPVPRRLPAVRLRGRHRRGGPEPLPRAGRVLLPSVSRIGAGFEGAPGYQSEATFRSSLSSQVRRAARAVGERATDLRRDRRSRMGHRRLPDTVRERLEASITDLRFGHLLCLIQIGNMSDELVRMNTSLFADKVLPGLRGRWPGYEDRWWPASMQLIYLHGIAGRPCSFAGDDQPGGGRLRRRRTPASWLRRPTRGSRPPTTISSG